MLRATWAPLLVIGLWGGTVRGQSGQTNPEQPPPKRNMERGRDFLGLAPPADPEAAARGQKVYAQACAFCHGPNATGAEGPDLLRSPVVLHDDKGEKIGPFLQQGRPDKGMPAFAAMTEAQARDIAEFLHMRVEAAANRFGYKVQNIVTGDAKAGERYFNSQCKSCHSATGDLAHIGKTDPADLQAHFLYPDQNAQKVAVTATVTLASGKTVSGALKRLDDFDVSLIDGAGDYRSFERASVKLSLTDPLEGHRELLAQYSDADMHNILAYLVTLK
jgi:cytochrome c oxidase cbb3-type subunit 3